MTWKLIGKPVTLDPINRSNIDLTYAMKVSGNTSCLVKTVTTMGDSITTSLVELSSTKIVIDVANSTDKQTIYKLVNHCNKANNLDLF
jgi:hypothetical protein